tara:strand:+ start:59799 stop:60275 length:477 start_codon:yes stop_codon:yes gene_type:complete
MLPITKIGSDRSREEWRFHQIAQIIPIGVGLLVLRNTCSIAALVHHAERRAIMSTNTIPLPTSDEKKEVKEIDSDVEALKSDFESLKGNVNSLMASVSRLAGKQAEKSADKGKALADDAVDTLESTRDSIQSQIRSKPLAAVGIAAGVGALIAIATRR